jgi:thiol-disulfide isomerase/thioredoxin
MLSVLFSTMLTAQNKNKIIVDDQLNKEILFGMCDRKGLTSDVFAEHYFKYQKDYTIDTATILKIKELKKGVEIVTVMGSWCYDSKMQVPRFYKIIDEAGFRDSKLKLIAVDRDKTAGDVDISGMDIQRVPTFIFYKKGREIGRIVESPTSTLEKDILLILTMGS